MFRANRLFSHAGKTLAAMSLITLYSTTLSKASSPTSVHSLPKLNSNVTHCDSEESVKPPKMYYRMLGNTGLQVSVLSYGFWATFGTKNDLQNDDGLEKAISCLKTARDGGINTFDNAEVYGKGEAERIMGEALKRLRIEDPEKWRRSDIIITTKLFWGFSGGVNEIGLSKKHIMEGADAALQRLQLDYVDLIFCHRPDPLTPTETIVRAMTDLIRSGKATAWGTSEWSAQQITEAVWIAKLYGLEPPQFEQPQYHMFHRARVENEYHPLYSAPYNIGTTIWSPLASGLLTGKYNDDVPEGSRASAPQFSWLQKNIQSWKEEGKIDKVKKLEEFAKQKYGCSVGQLAIAWCIKNKHVSTVLLGATKPEQLKENIGAIEVAEKITEEDLKSIDDILGNKPEAYGGYGGSTQWRSISTI